MWDEKGTTKRILQWQHPMETLNEPLTKSKVLFLFHFY